MNDWSGHSSISLQAVNLTINRFTPPALRKTRFTLNSRAITKGTVVRKIGIILALLTATPAAAMTRAAEIAECGFLANAAVVQLKERADQQPDYDALRRDVVALTWLYYHVSDRDAPYDGPGISPEMLKTIANKGRAIHARRVAGMGQANALKLANRVLADCRLDLSLFAKKDRAN